MKERRDKEREDIRKRGIGKKDEWRD